jgi:hypothetical protein
VFAADSASGPGRHRITFRRTTLTVEKADPLGLVLLGIRRYTVVPVDRTRAT